MKKIILIFVCFIILSCSVFQSKYINIEEEFGRCWIEFEANLESTKLIKKSNTENSKIKIILIDSKGEKAEYRAPDTGQKVEFEVKLEKPSINYEFKFDQRVLISTIIESGEYTLSISNNIVNQNTNEDLNENLGLFKIGTGEEKEIHIKLIDIEPCESYIVNRKVLRREFKKNN